MLQSVTMTDYLFDLLGADAFAVLDVCRADDVDPAKALPAALRQLAIEHFNGLMAVEWMLSSVGYDGQSVAVNALVAAVDFDHLAAMIIERGAADYVRRYRADVRMDARLAAAIGDSEKFADAARASGLSISDARDRVRLILRRTVGYQRSVSLLLDQPEKSA